MNKKVLIVLLGVLVPLAIIVSLAITKPASPNSQRLTITASFYPMAEFARQVGGDKVAVTTLVKPGIEPHDYEPAPGDLATLYRSKLFIYNGAGLEKWVSRIQPELLSNHVTTVDASTDITLRPADPTSADAGITDPHIWLDPVLAAQQVTTIEGALARIDPSNATYYHDHATAFRRQLADLDHDYRSSLVQCSQHTIITSHQAFGYLAAHYNFSTLSIAGLSPDQEPTPQQLATIADFAKAHHINYIFFETLVSPKLSNTIAKEAGANTLVFNPLEGLTADQINHGANYLTIQHANLSNLRIALNCK